MAIDVPSSGGPGRHSLLLYAGMAGAILGGLYFLFRRMNSGPSGGTSTTSTNPDLLVAVTSLQEEALNQRGMLSAIGTGVSSVHGDTQAIGAGVTALRQDTAAIGGGVTAIRQEVTDVGGGVGDLRSGLLPNATPAPNQYGVTPNPADVGARPVTPSLSGAPPSAASQIDQQFLGSPLASSGSIMSGTDAGLGDGWNILSRVSG